MTLTDYQHELGGVVLGTGTVYPVARLDGLGLPGMRTQDSALATDDGEVAGVDRLEGREVTWEGGVKLPGDPSGALNALATLQNAFDNVTVRATANAVLPLRIKMPGREVRVLFGRPRRFDYDDSTLALGWLTFTATFRATDPRFYSDTPTTLSLGVDASTAQGVVAPVVAPVTTTAVAPLSRPGYLLLGGTAPSWPVIRFTGPCANPRLENRTNGAYLALDVTLPAGEYIECDTRPGLRSVLRNGVANASGQLTRGSRLGKFRLDPGTTELRYLAVDATASSRVDVTARSAWKSL
jgi:hypothetical protein